MSINASGAAGATGPVQSWRRELRGTLTAPIVALLTLSMAASRHRPELFGTGATIVTWHCASTWSIVNMTGHLCVPRMARPPGVHGIGAPAVPHVPDIGPKHSVLIRAMVKTNHRDNLGADHEDKFIAESIVIQ